MTVNQNELAGLTLGCFKAQRSESIVCAYLFVCSLVNQVGLLPLAFFRAPPSIMVQGPPSSDSEGPSDALEYQYESEGEEALGSVCSLFHEAGWDYRRKSFQD